MSTRTMLLIPALITALILMVSPSAGTAAQAQTENMTMEELTNATLAQDNATMEELTNALVGNMTGNMTGQNMTSGNITA